VHLLRLETGVQVPDVRPSVSGYADQEAGEGHAVVQELVRLVVRKGQHRVDEHKGPFVVQIEQALLHADLRRRDGASRSVNPPVFHQSVVQIGHPARDQRRICRRDLRAGFVQLRIAEFQNFPYHMSAPFCTDRFSFVRRPGESGPEPFQSSKRFSGRPEPRLPAAPAIRRRATPDAPTGPACREPASAPCRVRSASTPHGAGSPETPDAAQDHAPPVPRASGRASGPKCRRPAAEVR